MLLNTYILTTGSLALLILCAWNKIDTYLEFEIVVSTKSFEFSYKLVESHLQFIFIFIFQKECKIRSCGMGHLFL